MNTVFDVVLMTVGIFGAIGSILATVHGLTVFHGTAILLSVILCGVAEITLLLARTAD